MKTTRAMPAFNGVAEGATATLNCPIGLTYHGLILTRGGTAFTNAHIAELRVKGDGRELMVMSGAQLDAINLFDGHAAAGSALTYLDFERPNLKTRAGVELTAIGTGMPQNLNQGQPGYNPTPLSTLQVEVDISGSTGPTLSAKAVQSGPSPLGTLKKRRRFTYSVAGAGDYEISDLPKGDLIDKIYVFHTGNVTGVKLDRDNFRAFDRSDAENDLIQTDGVRVPQSNLFVIDPSERGNGGEAIVSAVSDFRLIVTTSGLDTLTVLVDYLGGLRGN